MKKFIITLLVIGLLAMSLVLYGCGSSDKSSDGSSKQSETKEPYKIGLLTTISGPVGFVGQDIRDAAQVEVDRINAAGGINGHPIELIVEDNGMDSAKAVAGFTKLVKQDKVMAVTGTFGAFMEPALRAVAEREQVSLFLHSPPVPEMRARKDKYTFNNPPNEYIRVAAWLDILKEKGYTSVAGISAADTAGEISLELLKKEAEGQGIKVSILPDTVDPNAVDITPQIIKLKELATREKAQVIVSTLWAPNIPAQMKTMKQLGLNLPTITWEGVADPPLLTMGGDELNGLVTPGVKILAGSTLPDKDPQKAIIVDFIQRYETKTKRPAGTMSGLSADAINIIADALKVAGADWAKLRDEIEKTKNYMGLTGIYNYSAEDHEGLPMDCLGIYEIKDLKFVYLRNTK